MAFAVTQQTPACSKTSAKTQMGNSGCPEGFIAGAPPKERPSPLLFPLPRKGKALSSSLQPLRGGNPGTRASVTTNTASSEGYRHRAHPNTPPKYIDIHKKINIRLYTEWAGMVLPRPLPTPDIIPKSPSPLHRNQKRARESVFRAKTQLFLRSPTVICRT